MKKSGMKKYWCIIIVALALPYLQGCKKGEKDPFLSFRSRKARLTGAWNMDVYRINGMDTLNYNITNYYYSLYCQTSVIETIAGTLQAEIIFRKDGRFDFIIVSGLTETYYYASDTFCSDNSSTFSNENTMSGDWNFKRKKSELEMQFDVSKEVWIFDIVRLSNKELELEGMIDGENVEMELEKE